MSRRLTTDIPPMRSGGSDEWLYVADPVEGCGTCEGADRALKAAIESHDATARFEAARIIHLHPHTGAGPPG